MLRKRYVKKAYILEAICDKCGSVMESTGMVYSTYPAQYPYRCSNSDCDGQISFQAHEMPGKIYYEFEDENENLTDDFVQNLKKMPSFIHTVDTAIIEDIQYV